MFWYEIQDLHKENILTYGELHIMDQTKAIQIGFGMK